MRHTDGKIGHGRLTAGAARETLRRSIEPMVAPMAVRRSGANVIGSSGNLAHVRTSHLTAKSTVAR